MSSADGRREGRVPLGVLIELRSDEGDEMLEADGLDLSPHGMAMRASFVPPVGAPLRCHFRCPPDGDPVRVEGEVVWSEWVGPRVGAFGVRFSALDTKSATAIRRYVEPDCELDEPPEPEPERVATMRIDGLGAPIEADVRLADAGRVVLEQELAFLKLGRGVEVDVPGRGKQRGRIGSVELRHNHLDVPTLVFGILLDEATRPEPLLERAAAPFVSDAVVELEAAFAPDTATMAAQVEDDLAPSEPSCDTWPERPVFAEVAMASDAVAQVEAAPVREAAAASEPEKVTALKAVARKKRPAEPRVEAAEAPTPRPTVSPAVLQGAGALVAWFVRLRALVIPFLAALRARAETLRQGSWPALRDKLQGQLAELRSKITRQGERLKAARAARAELKTQRTTAPAPRVQRPPQAPAPREQPAREQGARGEARPAPRGQVRNRRLYAVALASAGVALGIYALAPRSGADRIRTPREGLRPTAIAPQAPAPVLAAPVLVETAAPSQVAPAAALPTAAPVVPAENPAAATRVFGAAEVPNGRTFVLRMSGPVDDVEGDMREDGFTVRVPGRLAMDRASPIATSHKAVARAMILNRGDYAELTVDFLPGMHPKYQVIGKDSTIEVTLERQ